MPSKTVCGPCQSLRDKLKRQQAKKLFKRCGVSDIKLINKIEYFMSDMEAGEEMKLRTSEKWRLVGEAFVTAGIIILLYFASYRKAFSVVLHSFPGLLRMFGL